MRIHRRDFRQPTGALEELEADWVILALGQEVDLSLLENIPGLEVEGRWSGWVRT